MIDKLFTFIMSLASVVLGAVFDKINANKKEAKDDMRERQRICREALEDKYMSIIRCSRELINLAPKDILARLDDVSKYEHCTCTSVRAALNSLLREEEAREVNPTRLGMIRKSLDDIDTLETYYERYYHFFHKILVDDEVFSLHASHAVKSAYRSFVYLLQDGYMIGSTGFVIKNNKTGKDINLFDDARARLIDAMKLDLGIEG